MLVDDLTKDISMIRTLFFLIRIYGIVEILSIIIHALVYLKIYLYKKKEKQQYQQNEAHQENSKIKIDSESLTSFGINVLIILCLGSTTIAARRTGNVEPVMLNDESYSFSIYYNNFIVTRDLCYKTF
jgi:hypothetical protein